MVDEARKHALAVLGVAKPRFGIEVDIGEDALNRGVGVFDRRASLVELIADARGQLLELGPAGALSKEEFVFVGIVISDVLRQPLADALLRFLLEAIRQALQEQKAKDV